MHKKIVSALFACILLLGGVSLPAFAATDDYLNSWTSGDFSSSDIMVREGTKRKKTTEAQYISLLFYKLVEGLKPPYEMWAKESESYLNSDDMYKNEALLGEIDFLQYRYRSLKKEDPIIVHMTTNISAYSKKNGGFYVENFRPDLFFSFEHRGNHFAVIPADIEAYQWYEAKEQDLNMTGLDLAETNEVDLQIMLVPESADSKAPAKLGDNHHWIITASVKEIQMWSKDGRLLWSGQKAGVDNKVLDLYKN